jgi:hypothetical protein
MNSLLLRSHAPGTGDARSLASFLSHRQIETRDDGKKKVLEDFRTAGRFDNHFASA